MDTGKIYFRNEPFMALVDGKGEEPIRCTPIVYDSPTSCGVGIAFDDDTMLVWGMLMPRNLIAAWRATEVLRHLRGIENRTLAGAYYASTRVPDESQRESYAEGIIKEIGETVHQGILKKPVPEEIIQAILQNQGNNFSPDLYPITPEVRAGTIEWRQEFAEAGIEHPDDADEKKQVREETLAQFEELLTSYAQSIYQSRTCVGMWHTEAALIALVEANMSEKYPDHVIVALAGTMSSLMTAGLMAFTMSVSFPDPEGWAEKITQIKEDALTQSAEWLVSQERLRPTLNQTLNQASAVQFLEKVFKEYFLPNPESDESNPREPAAREPGVTG